MLELFRHARRTFTPPLLAVMDAASRRWLDRVGNPHLGELREISVLLGKSGAYALNTSYEWSCTSGVGDDPWGGARLLRVLDWQLAGLGRSVVVALQRGPAGDFANITWPGYVGVVTAVAPGRFAVAINQPPRMSWRATPPIDWAIGRARLWRSNALPPSHLLRHVCETCTTYEDAKRLLSAAPLCLPAFFVLAGATPGAGCVIERAPSGTVVREMPAAAANHWVELPLRGRGRGRQSRERLAQMTAILADSAGTSFCAPIINRNTRLVALMSPGPGRLLVQGWEHSRPATAELALDLGVAFAGLPELV
ncbi:MAG TPA: carcinine hydrolase/isopenicillin-N N-acyltransferase family protein [Stellaceae bacterium]|nr:carcinine hydrolase/isopenicillin-N N-acyltransferase family protein [Stellaceae bacterium]